MAGTAAEVSGPLPPGLRVEGSPAAIRAAWAAICPLQPVRVDAQGVVCAPRSAPELAGPALAACPLPVRALEAVPGWPDPPAEMVGGWYRRGPGHAPAPAGVRELVQAPGEGFGPAGHATTAMCLDALDGLPAGPALDAGCGSGLLAQAWAALGRGPVLAVDLDPRALDQAARSLRLAGLAARVELRRGPLGALAPADLAGRVVLANVPAPAHAELLGRVDAARPPRAAVLSGLRPGQVAAVVAGWEALGLRAGDRAEAGGFVCVTVGA
ncbi:MAG: 50S ribosomal protein L11 methyltransferase [Candidatus Nanopelagicales bacterium]